MILFFLITFTGAVVCLSLSLWLSLKYLFSIETIQVKVVELKYQPLRLSFKTYKQDFNRRQIINDLEDEKWIVSCSSPEGHRFSIQVEKETFDKLEIGQQLWARQESTRLLNLVQVYKYSLP